MEGERLAELRKGRKIGQKEFAELMGISVSALSKFAEYFNVSMDYLMGLTREEVPIRHTESGFLYFDNLPEAARTELCSFLEYLRKRYRL